MCVVIVETNFWMHIVEANHTLRSHRLPRAYPPCLSPFGSSSQDFRFLLRVRIVPSLRTEFWVAGTGWYEKDCKSKYRWCLESMLWKAIPNPLKDWDDDSICKVLDVQSRGPEFNSQYPFKKENHAWQYTLILTEIEASLGLTDQPV